ncbi:MAG: resolvase, partial [Thaumarchaeota archaeon]|nr:resolvase [Nitrososphaerota archaeon]
MKKNNKKTNKIRRQRGYAFENHIVQRFNDISGWSAKRLGSPSTALPDVMVINDMYKTVIAIEAKSTVQNYAYVPQDQIERCRDWVN